MIDRTDPLSERTSNDYDGLLKGMTTVQAQKAMGSIPFDPDEFPKPNYPERLTVEILKDDEQYVKKPLQGVIGKFVTRSRNNSDSLRNTSDAELEHYIRYSATLVDAWEVADFGAILQDAKREAAKYRGSGEDNLLRVTNLIQVEVMMASLEHEVDKIINVYAERGSLPERKFVLEAKATFRAGLQMLASEVVRTKDWPNFEVELRLINGNAELVLHHNSDTRISREQ